MRTLYPRLQRLLIKSRWLWISTLNVILTLISFSAAVLIRSELIAQGDSIAGRRTIAAFWAPLMILCCCRLAAYSYFCLNRGYWRYVSTREAVEVVESHLCSSLVFFSLIQTTRVPYSPPSLILLEFVFSVSLALGARLSVRLFCEHYLLRGLPGSAPIEALVLGAGATGHLVVKTLIAEPRKRYQVNAVLDDDPARQGMLVHGVRVVGPLTQLDSYLRQFPRVSMVMLAIPSLAESKRQRIKKVCEDLHVPLEANKLADGLVFQELADTGAPVPIDQLLNRKPQFGNQRDIALALAGKRVLITGAGGSIGSELVRQVARHGPAQLILVDKSEFNLYAIGQELSTAGAIDAIEVSYHLTDIVNQARLLKLFESHRPQLVFHAAAYKHVPLLENNGYEAFLNNIIGTLHMLQASKECRVERFVFVSTDKAVEPSSTMGCTKRVCELMVQQVNEPASAPAFLRGKDHQLETAVVRFGNVINSAGSVIPLFKKQILTGNPITVTDEKVERYFMSIPEAASLILTAGTLGHQGEIFMLDMGKPIKITEVAKKLRALYGRRDVPIKIVGLRPGEKLTEELYYSNEETRTKTRFDKVFAVRSPKSTVASSVFNWTMEVAPSLNHLTDQQITQMLRSYTRSIQNKKAAETRTAENSSVAYHGVLFTETPR